VLLPGRLLFVVPLAAAELNGILVAMIVRKLHIGIPAAGRRLKAIAPADMIDIKGRLGLDRAIGLGHAFGSCPSSSPLTYWPISILGCRRCRIFAQSSAVDFVKSP